MLMEWIKRCQDSFEEGWCSLWGTAPNGIITGASQPTVAKPDKRFSGRIPNRWLIGDSLYVTYLSPPLELAQLLVRLVWAAACVNFRPAWQAY